MDRMPEPGERVLISGSDHPLYGSTGVVGEYRQVAGSLLGIVKLDKGGDAGFWDQSDLDLVDTRR